MNRKVTAALLVAAAVLSNLAFTALGSIFSYPDVLREPVDEILALFRASQGAVVFWFGVLALAASLFAPIAVGVGRLSSDLLTAAWTLLVLAALDQTLAGRWFTVLGLVSAVLILSGIFSPLSLPGVDTANFAGYVLWSVWLLAFAVLLVRRPANRTRTRARPTTGTAK